MRVESEEDIQKVPAVDFVSIQAMSLQGEDGMFKSGKMILFVTALEGR